jgi:hypothetical protein
MSIRNDVVDYLIEDLKGTGEFKKVYKNIVPVWSQVKSFPAVAVIYESEEKESDSISSKSCYYVGTVKIYIYNKQTKTKFDDILTDLIDTVYKVVEENDLLCNYVVSSDIASMKREGGLIHPYAVAEIQILVRYKLSL